MDQELLSTVTEFFRCVDELDLDGCKKQYNLLSGYNAVDIKPAILEVRKEDIYCNPFQFLTKLIRYITKAKFNSTKVIAIAKERGFDLKHLALPKVIFNADEVFVEQGENELLVVVCKKRNSNDYRIAFNKTLIYEFSRMPATSNAIMAKKLV